MEFATWLSMINSIGWFGIGICALVILVDGIQAYVFALLTSLYNNDAENLH